MVNLSGIAPGDGEDNVATHVQIEREARGWSTAELARRVTEAGCSMSQSAIWRIENGEPRRKISVDELIAFSKVFGRPLHDLLKPVSPDYPAVLIRALLYEWMTQEKALWHAEMEATYYFSDLAQMLAIYPGAMSHLQELLGELLEESRLTFLEGKMRGRLNDIPKRLAEEGRHRFLFSPIALIAFWNTQGISRKAMIQQAEEWGFEELTRQIKEGVFERRGVIASIDRIHLAEDGSVEITPAGPGPRRHSNTTAS